MFSPSSKSLFALITVCLVISSSLANVPVKDYDYIIVGGGTAGLALATRLSQRLPKSTILTIEAGPHAPNELGINVPARRGTTLGTKYDWNFTTVPQNGLRSRVLPQNRGKVLGGSSALNYMTWNRATANEYQSWYDLGNPGWTYRAFSERMQRAENCTSVNSEWYGDKGVGRTGPIRANINRYMPAQQHGWIETLNRLGIETNREYNGGNSIGVSYQTNSIDPTHYNRSYSANSYLPLAGRNLEVLTETEVAKVIIERFKKGWKATGVTLLDGTVISARKEVIISAGSLVSPVLLERSGIGRKPILDAAGIKQLIDLPGVGENLQDHIRITTSYQLKDNYTSIDKLNYNATFAAEQLQLWIDGKYSMYDYAGSAYTFQTWSQASNTSTKIQALASSLFRDSTNPADKTKLKWLSDPTVPELEVILSDGYLGVKGYPPRNSSLYGKHFFTFVAAIMHPFSRGTVHINTTSPLSKPVIDPRYLSNEYDIQAAIAGIKRAREIALSPPLRDVWVSEYEPGFGAVPLGDGQDEKWREYVLNTTLSIFHPLGTCAMLPRTEGGVVDNNLRVYGVPNLRVVDASIMPVLISAHLQTGAYGIAEKAADIIVEAA
ncbi:choline dehydrogenase [Bisporella sp. PMI_857]|nr:choline dehydrogenase [Bisporella sp. PMI_857]